MQNAYQPSADQSHRKHIMTPSERAKALQRLAVEDHVLGLLYAAHKELKDDLAAEFTPGEKHEVKNPQGVVMASVSMSSPNKTAVCTDQAVLLGMASERGMELVDRLPANGTEAAERAIEVLLEYAPHLVDTNVSDGDRKALAEEVLEQWQITGKTPVGWDIRDASTPKFTLRKSRTKTAQAAMKHLAAQIDDLLAIESPTTVNGDQ